MALFDSWKLSLLNVRSWWTFSLLDVVRPMLRPDCPTHLLAPPSHHLFIIIELLIFPRTTLCHIKAAHSNERGALCFGRRSPVGGQEVALVCWC